MQLLHFAKSQSLKNNFCARYNYDSTLKLWFEMPYRAAMIVRVLVYQRKMISHKCQMYWKCLFKFMPCNVLRKVMPASNISIFNIKCMQSITLQMQHECAYRVCVWAQWCLFRYAKMKEAKSDDIIGLTFDHSSTLFWMLDIQCLIFLWRIKI